MWPGTANSGGWRSPQASAGTPNNTRELAQIDKKKPQLITVGASVLVEAAGIEPASVSPLPVALHAYSVFMFSPSQPGRQGARCSDSGKVLAVPPRTSFRAIL